MENFRQRFEESFHQLCLDQQKSNEFFSRFYDNFVEHYPQIKEKFANTDMMIQKDMLRMSFVYLIDFAQTLSETERLEELARVHSRAGKNITAQMYDYWLDALLATIEEVLPDVDKQTTLAWRIMLAPGIEYMKGRY